MLIVFDIMTKDEKKHFILDTIVNTPNITRFDTSFIASVLNITISDANILCRELIEADDLKDFSSMDNRGTVSVGGFTKATDAFNESKYLFMGSIDNIEFEILNYLKDKSTTEQTRINHILVASTSSVLHTTELLKKMIEDELIIMTPPPLSLRNDSNNKLIENHVLAFENLQRPIKANITFKGKTYFKEHFMDDNRTTNHFNFDKNSGNVLINQPSSSRDNAFESPIIQTINPTTEAKPPKRSWLEIASWVTGIILFIIAIYEFIIKHFLHLDK